MAEEAPVERSGSPALVRDLMTVGVSTCLPDTPLPDLARLLLDEGLESVVVLDPVERHALGVVGQDELVRAYSLPNPQALKAEQIMRDEVPSVLPDIPLSAAAQIMQDKGVRALFLIHHAGGATYPAAVITYEHVLRHLAARTDDDLRDLGIRAERQSPLQAFVERREQARKRNLELSSEK